MARESVLYETLNGNRRKTAEIGAKVIDDFEEVKDQRPQVLGGK